MSTESISELVTNARAIRAQGFTLQYWANGTYFVEQPNGEGTEVPEEAVAGVFAELFRKFF